MQLNSHFKTIQLVDMQKNLSLANVKPQNNKSGNLSSPVNHAYGTCYECNEYTKITGNCSKNSNHLLCSLFCLLSHSC